MSLAELVEKAKNTAKNNAEKVKKAAEKLAGNSKKAAGKHLKNITGADILGIDDEKKKKKIEALEKKNIAAAKAIKTPTYEKIKAENVEYTGDVDYSAPEFTSQQDSGMAGVSTDPRLKEAQMSALASLQGISANGGMTAEDRANLARSQTQAAQADRGRREAILQNANARGMGGSGMELLAQLDSSQAATDRQAQEGLDINGMAQKRALESMMQGGQLAGDMRNQDFGEQSDKARAQDAINQFNTGNKNTMNTHVADQSFGANQANRDSRQGLAMQNAGMNNQAQVMNKIDIPSKQYANSMAKHQAVSGANTSYKGFQRDDLDADQRQRQGWINMGTQAAAAASDETLKKDIKPVKEVDIEEFLGSFSPKSYRYKDSSEGEGKFTGFMAQDIAETKLGKEMIAPDAEGNLRYDPRKLQGIELAAIKFLADKIKDKK